LLLLGLALSVIACYTGTVTFAFWRASPGDSSVVETSPAGSRRAAALGLGLAVAAPAGPAMAYETYKDSNLGFTFKYPTGLQKSDSPFYNAFFRDLIEPLESVGVKVTDTKRKSLDEIGDAKEVAKKLMDDTIPEGAPRELLSAESKKFRNGDRYDIIEYVYQWKFDKDLAKRLGRKKFQLHTKALITIDRKKQYLVLTAAEDQRWPIQGDQLALGVDTFQLIFD